MNKIIWKILLPDEVAGWLFSSLRLLKIKKKPLNIQWIRNDDVVIQNELFKNQPKKHHN